MNRMWAPWRKAYIRPDKKKQQGCVFCRLFSEKSRDVKNLVISRSKYSFAVLNLYPYNNGHLLIVPNRHVDRLSKLSNEEKLDWLSLYENVLAALEKEMHPQGFNIGMNLGRAAGAGIPKHLHLHIVPRWKGDVNFMPVLSDAKVISESLESVQKILAKHMKSKSPRKLKGRY